MRSPRHKNTPGVEDIKGWYDVAKSILYWFGRCRAKPGLVLRPIPVFFFQFTYPPEATVVASKECPVVFRSSHMEKDTPVFHIGRTPGHSCLFAYATQGRHEYAHQHGDDGDDNQQLYERETPLFFRNYLLTILRT